MDQAIYVFYFGSGDPMLRVSQPIGSVNSAMEWVKTNPLANNVRIVMGTVIGYVE